MEEITELQRLMYRRIGWEETTILTFDLLPKFMRDFATAIPFENLDIVGNTCKKIDKENLIDKILVRNTGGMCYQLNTIAYLFLLDCGFDIVQTTTFTKYPVLLDLGLGHFLPLAPVPLGGKVVKSITGSYRFVKLKTEYGTHALEGIWSEGKRSSWEIYLAFNLDEAMDISSKSISISFGQEPQSPDTFDSNISSTESMDTTDSTCANTFAISNQSQRIVIEDPLLLFNRRPILMIIRPLSHGKVVMTDTSITTTDASGKKTSKDITPDEFQDLLYKVFNFKK
eukprot:gene11947-13922_t